MLAFLRNALIALILTTALVLLVTTETIAQSWTSSQQTGLTSVRTEMKENTYIWTLTNNSSLPKDTYAEFDILVWDLTPFQVREPISWAAPEGWTWSGSKWHLMSGSDEKYFTPHALAPGQSVVFEYTPDPLGSIINSSGPQPSGIAFIAHVGAVIPGSGSLDGDIRWADAMTPQGLTWYDRPEMHNIVDPVPEPLGLLVLSVGVMALSSRLAFRTCRSTV